MPATAAFDARLRPATGMRGRWGGKQRTQRHTHPFFILMEEEEGEGERREGTSERSRGRSPDRETTVRVRGDAGDGIDADAAC